MLDVLIYLFENFMIEDEAFQPDQDRLTSELSRAGFTDEEIDKAFEWLEHLTTMCEEEQGNDQSMTSLRLFTDEEQQRLPVEARGLLLSLEQSGVLESTTRELVIDRILALEDDEIDLEDVKWVVMMVLLNRADPKGALSWVESLVLDGVDAHLH